MHLHPEQTNPQTDAVELHVDFLFVNANFNFN